MTLGEQLVWASVFAKYYNINNPPSEATKRVEHWEAWEQSQMLQAVECAAGAVQRLRESFLAVQAGFGKDSFALKCLREILGWRDDSYKDGIAILAERTGFGKKKDV